MCTTKHKPCTRYAPLGVILVTSMFKDLKDFKEACLIVFNLEQCFSGSNVYKIHKGILLKFQLVVGPVSAFLRSYRVPADTTGLRTPL